MFLGGRVRLAPAEPWAEVGCEVDAIIAYPIAAIAGTQYTNFVTAAGGSAEEFSALRDLYETFAREARPSWDLVDPKGPVPPDMGGFLRVPVPLMVELIDAWVTTFEVPGG